MKTILFYVTLFSAITMSSANVKYFLPGDIVEFDTIPYMVKDPAFEESYEELSDMFDGKTFYSLKRAEFLVENAYYGGVLEYCDFIHDIDSVVAGLNRFIDSRNIRKYKTATNYAFLISLQNRLR